MSQAVPEASDLAGGVGSDGGEETHGGVQVTEGGEDRRGRAGGGDDGEVERSGVVDGSARSGEEAVPGHHFRRAANTGKVIKSQGGDLVRENGGRGRRQENLGNLGGAAVEKERASKVQDEDHVEAGERRGVSARDPVDFPEYHSVRIVICSLHLDQLKAWAGARPEDADEVLVLIL